MNQDRLLMTRHSSRRLLFWLVSFAVVGVGCTKAHMYHHTYLAPTDFAPAAGVTVVLGQFSGEFSDSKEDKFVGCVTDAIRKVRPAVRIVPSDEFRQAAFPDLPPEEVGHWQWVQLADDPVIRQRIAPLGVRYLITVSGGTTQNNMKLFLASAGQYSYLVYMGKAGDRRSFVNATVIDLKQGSRVGHVEASAFNTTGFGWSILPLPFFFPAPPTETRVCGELGEGVAAVLAGGKPPDHMEAEQPEETLPAWMKLFEPVIEETLRAMTEELGTSTGKAEEDDCWPPCSWPDQSC